jgi:hypothetical protein
MFERYTEKARRVIFLARYEASRYGSPYIQGEHVLLGLIREHKGVQLWIPGAQLETIQKRIDDQTTRGSPIPTSVDLPLSDSCRTILNVAADEAERLGHRHIGTEHLFLALFSVDGLAAKVLAQAGADPAVIRGRLAEQSKQQAGPLDREARMRGVLRTPDFPVEIHGIRRNTNYIRDVVKTVRMYNWHWHKTKWKPRDIVIHLADGKFSFEMSLAGDAEKFMVVAQGWKKDRCFICGWELFESHDEHGTGYTNGRNWLCMECCERFIQKDFFSSSHPEMT